MKIIQNLQDYIKSVRAKKSLEVTEIINDLKTDNTFDIPVWEGPVEFGVIDYVFTLQDDTGQDHHFFTFINPTEMPVKRALEAMKHLEFCNLKINADEFKAHMDMMKLLLDKGKLGDSIILLDKIISRVNNESFDPIAVIKLASVIYFTKDEDLTRYDTYYNSHKIELFLKKNAVELFTMTGLKELIPFLDISGQDLMSYLMINLMNQQKMLKGLIIMLDKVESEDTEKNQMRQLYNSVLNQVLVITKQLKQL